MLSDSDLMYVSEILEKLKKPLVAAIVRIKLKIYNVYIPTKHIILNFSLHTNNK